MLAPLVVFFVWKKQQYHGEIALVTNLRPLMSEQSLKFGYILYCLNGDTSLKYSLISGAILTIDFSQEGQAFMRSRNCFP